MHSRLTNDRQLEHDPDAADPPQTQVHLSVVAPCYNEQEVLGEFYRRVKAVCETTSQSYEIMLVNDGSCDRTWEIMKEIAENDPCVVAGRPVAKSRLPTGADRRVELVPGRPDSDSGR
jgi:cellulose synthase/poly-beta-1,6-N-acetylglucosamine synthase-like glycosyltransferase